MGDFFEDDGDEDDVFGEEAVSFEVELFEDGDFVVFICDRVGGHDDF